MKVGDRILTNDGLATIKAIEHYRGQIARVGLVYDKMPIIFQQSANNGLFKDNILYHYPAEVSKMTLIAKNEEWLFNV